jgi:hypothetical protein
MKSSLFSVFLLSFVSCQSVPEGGAAPATTSSFSKKLSLQGVSFTVSCPNNGSLNQVVITPAGLEGGNEVVTAEADGSVTGAEVADLNGDGSPEIYLYVTSAGSGSYGSLIAYAANNKKSLSEIYLPELPNDSVHLKGYMGHDEFAVVENSLVRRFKTYNEGDANAVPTGKTRQLQYRLQAGEAGWKLRLDQVTEF